MYWFIDSILPTLQFIAVVIVTAVLDVIQLGIWFDFQQTTLDRGDGSSKLIVTEIVNIAPPLGFDSSVCPALSCIFSTHAL